MQEQIEQSKAEESTQSLVPGTVRAAAEQAENFSEWYKTYGKHGVSVR